jgi:hypothetical protein
MLLKGHRPCFARPVIEAMIVTRSAPGVGQPCQA